MLPTAYPAMSATPLPDGFLLDDDDLPKGTVLSRREAIRYLGGAALALFGGGVLAACSMTDDEAGDGQPNGVCVAQPELTEGPYYVDENLNRSDIRPNTADGVLAAGLPLALAFNVTRLNGSACEPLEGAVVDVWHADAAGVYSEFGAGQGQDSLRGYQLTDASGNAAFTTVYPGWYAGRAVHIHFKVRSQAGGSSGYEFTSQLFFDDSYTDQVYRRAPYNARGARTTLNGTDGIYRQGGTGLVLAVSESGEGYTATFNIALTDA